MAFECADLSIHFTFATTATSVAAAAVVMLVTASTATDIAVVAAAAVVVVAAAAAAADVAVVNDAQVVAVVEYVDVIAAVVAEPFAFAGAGAVAASSDDGAWKSFQPKLGHHSNLMSGEA